MPRFEEKVGARLRRDPSDLASYYSCSFIKRDSGGGTRIRSSSPPPPPKMVILVQRPFERVLSRGLTVAVYSSLFDRSKSKRMDPSQEQKKNIHIYIYIHIRNEDLFVVGPCPNRHITNGVTSVTDTDLLSLSLSLFGYLRSRSDL